MSDIFYIHFVILHLYMKHYSTKAICKSYEFSKKKHFKWCYTEPVPVTSAFPLV